MSVPLPSDAVVAEVIEEYKNGASMAAIGIKRGMSRHWAFHVLKRAGIKRRPRGPIIRYTINQHFFKSIDSHDKAICLGFIWADGCLGHAKGKCEHLRITLSKCDLQYLEWMNELMQNTRPIYLSDRFAVLVAYHPQIVSDLRGLGIYERKSLTIGAPTLEQVPAEFLSSFVLGVFEGDGCITKGTVNSYYANICGSVGFCKWLQKLLKEQLDIGSSITYSATKNGAPLARIGVGGNRQVIRLMEWMYEKAPHKMDRKWRVYLKLRGLYDAEMNLIVSDETRTKRADIRRAIRARWTFSEHAKIRIGQSHWIAGYIKSPDGQIFFMDGTKPFCKEYCLCPTNLGAVRRGAQRHHKGWTLPTEFEIESARSSGTLIEKRYRVSMVSAKPQSPQIEATPTDAVTVAA